MKLTVIFKSEFVFARNCLITYTGPTLAASLSNATGQSGVRLAAVVLLKPRTVVTRAARWRAPRRHGSRAALHPGRELTVEM